MEEHWTKLYSTSDPIQAEITKQMLEQHGIPAVVLNKQDSSYRFGQAELYVHESQAALARSLIKENEQGNNEA